MKLHSDGHSLGQIGLAIIRHTKYGRHPFTRMLGTTYLVRFVTIWLCSKARAKNRCHLSLQADCVYTTEASNKKGRCNLLRNLTVFALRNAYSERLLLRAIA